MFEIAVGIDADGRGRGEAKGIDSGDRAAESQTFIFVVRMVEPIQSVFCEGGLIQSCCPWRTGLVGGGQRSGEQTGYNCKEGKDNACHGAALDSVIAGVGMKFHSILVCSATGNVSDGCGVFPRALFDENAQVQGI